MNLKYSKNGLPYIELPKGAHLIFSTSTESSKGFKFLVFDNKITRTLCISGAKAKKKKYVNISENCNFTTTMDFDKIPRKAKDFGLSNMTKKMLKKMFSEFLVDGCYFPRENLETLELKLNKMNGTDEDHMDDDPTATESYDDE